MFENLITKWNWTTAIAIYGAVLATATLVWGIAKKLSDKPKLKIRYSFGFIGGLHPELTPIFSINLANTGRHKIIVSSLGIYFKKGNENLVFTSMADGFPLEINSGDAKEIFRKPSVFYKHLDMHGKPYYLWARDKTGREYRGSAKGLVKRMNHWKTIKEV